MRETFHADRTRRTEAVKEFQSGRVSEWKSVRVRRGPHRGLARRRARQARGTAGHLQDARIEKGFLSARTPLGMAGTVFGGGRRISGGPSQSHGKQAADYGRVPVC
jgi:hypothetical protein